MGSETLLNLGNRVPRKEILTGGRFSMVRDFGQSDWRCLFVVDCELNLEAIVKLTGDPFPRT